MLGAAAAAAAAGTHSELQYPRTGRTFTHDEKTTHSYTLQQACR